MSDPAEGRWLVCGGRHYNDRRKAHIELDRLAANRRVTTVITGGAPGADALAAEWAESRCVEHIVFPADWKRHGRAAGPIRNQRMLDEGQPSLVVAFPGGAGTSDMARRARAAGIQVLTVGARPQV